MDGSTTQLKALLEELTRVARAAGVNDSQWARAAGLRKESLSRLRKRDNCDFASLQALAEAVGMDIGVVPVARKPRLGEELFPARVDRPYEEHLLQLCGSRRLVLREWSGTGPRFFMAGVATMLASVRGLNRRALLELAEALNPGMSQPDAFQRWLAASPLRPARFIPLLKARLRGG